MSTRHDIAAAAGGTPVLPGFISHDETAARLGLTPGTLYSYRSRGRGPKPYKVGHSVFYREEEVEAWRNGTGSAHLKQHPKSPTRRED